MIPELKTESEELERRLAGNRVFLLYACAQRDDFTGGVQARDPVKPFALKPRLSLPQFLRPADIDQMDGEDATLGIVEMEKRII